MIGGTYEHSDHSPRVRIGHRLRAGPVCLAVPRGSGGDHCSCRFRFSISAMISVCACGESWSNIRANSCVSPAPFGGGFCCVFSTGMLWSYMALPNRSGQPSTGGSFLPSDLAKGGLPNGYILGLVPVLYSHRWYLRPVYSGKQKEVTAGTLTSTAITSKNS